MDLSDQDDITWLCVCSLNVPVCEVVVFFLFCIGRMVDTCIVYEESKDEKATKIKKTIIRLQI